MKKRVHLGYVITTSDGTQQGNRVFKTYSEAEANCPNFLYIADYVDYADISEENKQ